MGGTSSSHAGRRYRRARRLRHDREGVVAVIGTLLALLVFFALFGIFLTQYVPLWMVDNEALLTAQASTSFANFKSSVDAQYALGGPQSYGTPFTISSNGVPLIAQPTEGSLNFLPNTCPGGFFTKGTAHESAANLGQPVNPTYCVFVNVTESIGPGGVIATGPYTQSIETGVLELILPNRYYTPETFYYEDDAVIQSQDIGYQVMAFPPPLNITVNPGNVSVTDSLLQQYGNSSNYFGQGSAEVYSELRYAQHVTDNGGTNASFTYKFEIGTQYPCGWDTYLYHVLTTSGLPTTVSPTAPYYTLANTFNGTTYTIGSTYSGSCFNTNGATNILSFSLVNINYASLYLAGIQVGIGVGTT